MKINSVASTEESLFCVKTVSKEVLVRHLFKSIFALGVANENIRHFLATMLLPGSQKYIWNNTVKVSHL